MWANRRFAYAQAKLGMQRNLRFRAVKMEHFLRFGARKMKHFAVEHFHMPKIQRIFEHSKIGDF